MTRNFIKHCVFGLSLAFLPALNAHAETTMNAEIRHELVTLPYYNVFDWLTAETQPGGKVILPQTRTDAEARVRKVEGVTEVQNDIEVLPPSPTDDMLRTLLYRAIYNWKSPFFRYGTQNVPPIHIVVNNGRAELKGFVAN